VGPGGFFLKVVGGEGWMSGMGESRAWHAEANRHQVAEGDTPPDYKRGVVEHHSGVPPGGKCKTLCAAVDTRR